MELCDNIHIEIGLIQMQKEDSFEQRLTCTFIRFIAYTLKWLFLIWAIIFVGLTVSLLMVWIISYSNLNIDVVEKFIPFLTKYNLMEVTALIRDNGIRRVLIGTLANGVSSSVTYIMLYVVTSDFIKLFANITTDKIFSKESVDLVNEMLPLSVLLTFAQPVITFVASFATGVNHDANMSGITVLIGVYVLSLIFKKGYSIQSEAITYSNQLSSLKAHETDELMAKISKKQKESAKKKTTTKKTTKNKE